VQKRYHDHSLRSFTGSLENVFVHFFLDAAFLLIDCRFKYLSITLIVTDYYKVIQVQHVVIVNRFLEQILKNSGRENKKPLQVCTKILDFYWDRKWVKLNKHDGMNNIYFWHALKLKPDQL